VRRFASRQDSFVENDGTLELLETGERLRVKPAEASPCTLECPLGTNVKAYVSLIAAGRFEEALEEIRRTNPFPGICGRVCTHPCEQQCRRAEVDEPVAIAALKRFVADYELRRGVIPAYRPQRLPAETTSRAAAAGSSRGMPAESSEPAASEGSTGSIAVIGSGPAGLTCAADLARQGLRVTVYEASPIPGGMLSTGIPSYRLPRDILRLEIEAVAALGVDIRLNTPIGEKLGFEELLARHRAVFIAVGAQRSVRLGVPGEADVRQGLVDWVCLLREAALGQAQRPGRRIVVIGGGDAAVDCARVALRLGAETVQLLYRRSRQEMPAHPEQVRDAEEEGVTLSFLCAPKRLLTSEGRLTAVECLRMELGERDASGRRSPRPVSGSEFQIPCDALIPALGQNLDASFLGNEHGLMISPANLLAVDPDTLATSRTGVFAGGDAVSGPATVVEAIAAGQRAARSIRRFLRGLPLKTEADAPQKSSSEASLEFPAPERKARGRPARLSPRDRRDSFAEIEGNYTEAQAVAEAQRCLRCGPCLECRTCVGVCQAKQLLLEPVSHGAGNREPVEAAETLAAGDTLRQTLLIRVPPAIHRETAARGTLAVRYEGRPYQASVTTVRVDETRCTGCGVCEETCEYRAIRVIYRGGGLFAAQVDEQMCRGCGTCVSVCPTGAIDQGFYSRDRLLRSMKSVLQREERKLATLLLACRWSDVLPALPRRWAGNLVQLMCLGRLAPGDILRAYELGAAGVIVLGCRVERCHYGFGGRVAAENLQRLSAVLELLGIPAMRLRVFQDGEIDRAELARRLDDCARELASLEGGPGGRQR
jgi:NADPH-dependent glutamate synthase beta subunit-like oxidoreductase/coenzyme F420-reducing hydrogenase delta subunit/ferredoxin